jgi:hypothetical protein
MKMLQAFSCAIRCAHVVTGHHLSAPEKPSVLIFQKKIHHTTCKDTIWHLYGDSAPVSGKNFSRTIPREPGFSFLQELCNICHRGQVALRVSCGLDHAVVHIDGGIPPQREGNTVAWAAVHTDLLIF